MNRPHPTALMAIGGALRLEPPSQILEVFYTRSGRQHARIVIIPIASELIETGEKYKRAFSALGLTHPPEILEIRQRLDTHQPAFLRSIDDATGVFLTGGDQVRLTATLGGTPIEAALHAAFGRGVLIAGTSAGAAALPAVMLASGRSGPTPRQGIAQFAPGLGFTARLTIDQHFRQRDRLGRLLYAVANNPGVLGVGIDENTAMVLEGKTLSVYGQNAVTIVDGTGLQASNVMDVLSRRPIAMSGAHIHVLTKGCTFDLDERVAQLPSSRQGIR